MAIQRGRKSAASLQVAGVVELRRFPPAPDHLTDEQKDLWVMLVKSAAGDMIDPEAYPLLVEYCRTVSAANAVAEQIEQFDKGWLKDYEGLKRWDKLLAIQSRNSGILAKLSEKLRISPSSRTHAVTADRKAGKRRKPWEIEQEAN